MKGYERESKVFFIEKGAEFLAHEIYLYSKYLKNSRESLEQLYHSSTDKQVITELEKELIFGQAKKILFNKYKLKLISDFPIVVENIKEGYN